MFPKYVNRELSWLRFNGRVLQEAADEKVPLLERLRFLGIYSNNLDEFYAVRYSALIRAIQLEGEGYNNIVENQTNEQLISEINRIVDKQRDSYDKLYDEIFEKLKEENIFALDDKSFLEEHIPFVQDFFEKELSHSVGVYILKDELNVVPLRNGFFYLAVKLKMKDTTKYALLNIPTHIYSRFIELPSVGEKKYVVYIEDIVRYHLDKIFISFDFESIEAHSIKITRDSELDMDNDLKRSLVEKITLSLERRKKGVPVRIVYDRDLAKDTLAFLMNKLSLDEYDSINPGGRYHNKRDLMDFPDLGRKDLKYEKLKPLLPKKSEKYKSYFDALSNEDIMVYAPYHDYSIFLRFLRQAAIDPKVTKIKITIYRVAKQSQVMSALINAARNGKEVTAILELRARFDEENNLKWARRLEDSGVKIIFGVPGLKVHSKIGYIERLPEDGVKTKFSFISTGNFHAGTAKIYTDFTLLTSHEGITNEVELIFQFFKTNYIVNKYKHLLVSPIYLRKQLEKMIRREIRNHKKGLPSGINFKLNSFSDKKMIDLLYKASQKGVKVRLVVRGINCLVPQAPKISENIEAISVVDNLLEHPRVYWFKNGGNDLVYISSADLMERNLDRRVEVACPILDEKIKQMIMTTFDLSFNDNVKGRFHGAYESYKYRRNELPPLRSQIATYEYLKENN